MTREEAIAAGMEVHEIQHSMKRRTPWHDYSRKGTYMLTLVVRGRIALLGTLKGGLEGEVAPFVEYSVLGSTILQGEQKFKLEKSQSTLVIEQILHVPLAHQQQANDGSCNYTDCDYQITVPYVCTNRCSRH